MKFSVIIASYLGHYKNAATNREGKFIRSIQSLLNQTYTDYEGIIVSDGCEITKLLFEKHFSSCPQLKIVVIPKQRLWSGKVRNAGISAAQGDYITYLDTDDVIGVNHLLKINAGLGTYDWLWYDDYIVNQKMVPKPNACELKFGKCGTSNITHKRSLNLLWENSTYAHDWRFIQSMFKYANNAKVETTEYFICHIPGLLDV
jgi:glycosyltransferase involved in cell wall biosynthesis